MGLSGRCVCGAVRVEVARHDPAISACHCTLCRRWGGGVTMGFKAPEEAVEVTGPVKTHATTDFASRAWCGTCGSQLWLRDNDGPFELSPGLFDTGDLRLTREVYSDRAVNFEFAGDHERVTAAEYERRWRHV